MIVVKVELWSAIDGSKQELAMMLIDNIGGTQTSGDYRCRTLRGRSDEAFARALAASPMTVTREGRVTGHARRIEHNPLYFEIAVRRVSAAYEEKKNANY